MAFGLLVACAFLPHNSRPFVSEVKIYPGVCSGVSPCSPNLARPKPPLGAFFPGLLLLGRCLRSGGACESRGAAMETVKHMKAVKPGTVIC